MIAIRKQIWFFRIIAGISVIVILNGCIKGKPDVITYPVTNIGTTSAKSGGIVLDDNFAKVSERGICWNNYPNPRLGQDCLGSTIDGSGVGTFISDITNIGEGITYYVAAYATNSEGTSYGEDQSFNTKLCPVVSTLPLLSSDIGSGSATLKGTVNPNGESVTVVFEYGTSTSYGSEVTANQSPVTGTTDKIVTAVINNLLPSVIYHFRIKAESSTCTRTGEDQTIKDKSWTIIRVPTDMSTIQGAINLAMNYDTIMVSNGQYVEQIDFKGKKVFLTSNYFRTGDTSDIVNTIIEGYDNCVVRFQNLEDSLAIIDGFSIINGKHPSTYSPDSGEGGGIHIKNSHPTLRNLIIRNNSIFFPNTGGIGGGIFCSNGTIRGYNLIITQNSCGDGLGGGAIYCKNSTVYLRGCKITDNHTLMSGYYGGLYFENATFQILNSKLELNYRYPSNYANIIKNSTGEFRNSIVNEIISLVNSNVTYKNSIINGVIFP
jgi:predicted outer membrane repeat protein